MKIAISNLAWTAENEATILPCLADLGVSGIEVAPSRIRSWGEATASDWATARAKFAQYGLSVPSLQAVLFGVEGLHLLGDEPAFEAMLDHFGRVGLCGQALGATVAVFGAPKNRLKGQMSQSQARDLAIERFRRLGDVLLPFGMTIGIESVPDVYGADFLNHAYDVVDLVREIDHGAIKVHLDASCVMLAGDAIEDAVTLAGADLIHFHAAEPKLGNFNAPQAQHAAAAQALHQIGYDGWVSIEMLPDARDVLGSVSEAVIKVRAMYGRYGTDASAPS